MIPGLGSLGLSMSDYDGPATANGGRGPTLGNYNKNGMTTGQVALIVGLVFVLLLKR